MISGIANQFAAGRDMTTCNRIAAEATRPGSADDEGPPPRQVAIGPRAHR